MNIESKGNNLVQHNSSHFTSQDLSAQPTINGVNSNGVHNSDSTLSGYKQFLNYINNTWKKRYNKKLSKNKSNSTIKTNLISNPISTNKSSLFIPSQDSYEKEETVDTIREDLDESIDSKIVDTNLVPIVPYRRHSFENLPYDCTNDVLNLNKPVIPELSLQIDKCVDKKEIHSKRRYLPHLSVFNRNTNIFIPNHSSIELHTFQSPKNEKNSLSNTSHTSITVTPISVINQEHDKIKDIDSQMDTIDIVQSNIIDDDMKDIEEGMKKIEEYKKLPPKDLCHQFFNSLKDTQKICIIIPFVLLLLLQIILTIWIERGGCQSPLLVNNSTVSCTSITECNNAISHEHIEYNISTITCGYEHICKITNSSSTCSILMSIFPAGKLSITEIEDGFWVIITYAFNNIDWINLLVKTTILIIIAYFVQKEYGIWKTLLSLFLYIYSGGITFLVSNSKDTYLAGYTPAIFGVASFLLTDNIIYPRSNKRQLAAGSGLGGMYIYIISEIFTNKNNAVYSAGLGSSIVGILFELCLLSTSHKRQICKPLQYKWSFMLCKVLGILSIILFLSIPFFIYLYMYVL